MVFEKCQIYCRYFRSSKVEEELRTKINLTNVLKNKKKKKCEKNSEMAIITSSCILNYPGQKTISGDI